MAKYLVNVVETYRKSVVIEAEDETEAWEIAEDRWIGADPELQCDVAEDFDNAEFYVDGEVE